MDWVFAALLWVPTLLLAIVIAGATRWLGRRLTPLLMPPGCVQTVVIGAGGDWRRRRGGKGERRPGAFPVPPFELPQSRFP